MSDYLRLHRSHFDLKKFVALSLNEDLGEGDHTSLSTIPANHSGEMRLIVKEDGVIAGVEAAKKILDILGCKTRVTVVDGEKVKNGDIVFTVAGNTRILLTAERLVLNVMQRMSGIATRTVRLQALCKGTRALVCDTRKTTPGFRFFEKWAVHIGGGSNHRFGLYDMILIKDNHIDFCGGILEAIDAAGKYLKKKKLNIPVEVETRNLADVKKVVLHGGIDRIMLDNFSVKQTKAAVKLVGGKFKIESSGGITEKNLRKYARCGVDFISVGALTHHVRSMDLSLKAVSKG